MGVNAQGGYDPDDPLAMTRAAKADLVTLPINVAGTNCGNCLYVRGFFCTHTKVQQVVTSRMCCALWDAPGTRRPWT